MSRPQAVKAPLIRLDIPAEPERMVRCATCSQLYVFGTGTYGVCPTCIDGFKVAVTS